MDQVVTTRPTLSLVVLFFKTQFYLYSFYLGIFTLIPLVSVQINYFKLENPDLRISIEVKGHEIVDKVVFYHVIVKEKDVVQCVCKMRFQNIEAFHNNYKIGRFQPLPGKHIFSPNKTSKEFIETREVELDNYFTNFSHHNGLQSLEHSVLLQYFMDISKVPI